MSPGYNTFRGGTFAYEQFHALTPDDFSFDDTLYSDFSIGGTPEIFETDTFICTGDSIFLKATADRFMSFAFYATNDQVNDVVPLALDSLPTGPLTSDMRYWVEEADGPTVMPVRIVEFDKGDPDGIELQNVGSLPVDLSGWTLAINTSYTVINNFVTTSLSGSLAPGEILFYDDVTTSPNYFGANIFWNPGVAPTFTGWAMIIDNTGEVVDYFAVGWQEADIYGFNATINGFNITLDSDEWTGDGIGVDAVYQRANKDDNDASDWVSVPASSLGTTNAGLSLPFPNIFSSGCYTPRVPIDVIITPEPEVDFTFTHSGTEVTFTTQQ